MCRAHTNLTGRYAVKSSVVDPSGNVVWSGTAEVNTTGTAGTTTVTQAAALRGALLWEPQGTGAGAAMYTLRTALVREGQSDDSPAIDSMETRFGIRDLGFDPDRGLLVNGRPIKARGMCNHQDFAGVGSWTPGLRGIGVQMAGSTAAPAASCVPGLGPWLIFGRAGSSGALTASTTRSRNGRPGPSAGLPCSANAAVRRQRVEDEPQPPEPRAARRA